jgi:flagellar M-ring protein FliF
MADQTFSSEARTPATLQPLQGFAMPAEGGVTAMFSQPAMRKALPALALVSTVGIAALAWWSFQTPAQLPLFQGLAENDKAAVADALQSAGISYALDRDSGSITVAESELHKARMLLAGQGLPKAQPSSDTIVSSMPMGSSRAVEGETLRGAREADLARTIEAIDAVKTARVHLAVSEPSVFVRDEVKSAASVMLTLQAGRTLSNAQVGAMQHLVASSVPTLTPEQVSVVDQAGQLLSKIDNSVEDQNFQHQVQVEQRYRDSVATLLGPMVGRENFSTEVHADLDFTESQSTRETYPKEDAALRREEGNKTSATTVASPAIGIPGTTSNQPPPASQVATQPGGTQTVPAGGTPESQGNGQTAETYSRSFDVGREISVTHRPQGKVARLSVAVALRDAKGAKARTAAELTKIENLVKSAVGFDAVRGDVVAISSHAFRETVVEPPAWWDNPWIIPVARQVGGLLAALIVLLFVARPIIKALRKRAEKAEAEPDSEQIEQQLLAAANGPGVTLGMIEAAPNTQERATLVRDFVKQNPQRAALVVRQLMAGEKVNG